MTIWRFDCTNRFLSNFYPSEITVDGIRYPTVEHAFQAMKTDSQVERKRISLITTALDAKRAGRELPLIGGWEESKIDIMHSLVFKKFEDHLDLRIRLLNTGKEVIVEGNYWHDNFWGNCSCRRCRRIEGKNNLGRILMIVRAKFAGRR